MFKTAKNILLSPKQFLHITLFFYVVFFVGILFGFISVPIASAQTTQNNQMTYFTSASKEFYVPLNILLALSYNESRWKSHVGMSSDGGYGVMDLRTYPGKIVSGRDGSTITPPKQPASFYTLDQAAQLLNESPDIIKMSDQENIRGAAAILAQEAKKLNGGTLPTNVNDWYSAIAAYSGATDPTTASTFANDVYNTMTTGASSDDKTINLPASPNIQPNKSTLSALGLKAAPKTNLPGQNPECPPGLNCRFVAAAYAQDDPNDPGNYGNFDYAHRPTDMQIRYIYIHDTEGSYDSTISYFQNPLTYVSVHYVIRSSDGAITQMVPNEDVAWGIANWNMNMHGINIEHEGFAAQGATWYTEAMYQSSAKLVRWLATKYNIPLDRQHILGHDNVMYGPAAGQAAQHWDPGPFWDWDHYMDLLHGNTSLPATNSNTLSGNLKPGQVITIAPHFATNQPIVTDCQTGTCFTLASQGASFVYLHTQPRETAPLVSDPYLHPDNSAGTTEDSDWGDKAPSGFKYVVASVQRDWTGIWYAGQIGWFYNPQGAEQTAHRSVNAIVTLKPGLGSAPVYTEPYPEASAYPSAIPVQPLNTAYTMSAGQKYTTTADAVKGDYFYDATINYSLPDDHMVVAGKQKYYEIIFNHHVGFVKVEDVVVTP